MTGLVKWLAAVVLLVLLLLGGVAVALQLWVGSEDFRGRVGQQLSARLGVPVVLGGVTVDVWPLPAVLLDQVRIDSQPPLTLQQVEARPSWAPLLRGRLEIATLVVRNAVVPEQSLLAIAAAVRDGRRGVKDGVPATEGTGGNIGLLPRRTLLEQVTWLHAKGGSTTIDAQARLDQDGLPGSAQLQVRHGRMQGARATLERQPDHWALNAQVGGGTVTGKLQLQPGAKGASLLQGQFDTAQVEVAALTAPNRTLTGRLEAHTTLRLELSELRAAGDALQTQSRFTVRDAVVHGIDLAQAVKSVGQSRGGQTRLDTLAGHVVTRGRAVQIDNLVASSGLLSANGNVAIAPNRALSGRITVDLVARVAGGTLGVPLTVGGTIDSPSVSLSRGALLGAAIGTLAAPGPGTGAGAQLGERLGEQLRGLFGK